MCPELVRGGNLGDERKLLGELPMELTLVKQVDILEEQEQKGRGGAPRATEALGQTEARTLLRS